MAMFVCVFSLASDSALSPVAEGEAREDGAGKETGKEVVTDIYACFDQYFCRGLALSVFDIVCVLVVLEGFSRTCCDSWEEVQDQGNGTPRPASGEWTVLYTLCLLPVSIISTVVVTWGLESSSRTKVLAANAFVTGCVLMVFLSAVAAQQIVLSFAVIVAYAGPSVFALALSYRLARARAPKADPTLSACKHAESDLKVLSPRGIFINSLCSFFLS